MARPKSDLKPTTVRYPEDMLLKVKYIAWFSTIDQTDVYKEAVSAHIAKFEKKHGEITPEKLEQGRIKL